MDSPPDDKSPEDASDFFGADLIIPILACLLTGYYFVSTSELVWEAKATGLIVGIVLVALCCLQFVRIGLGVAAGRARLGLGGLLDNTLFNRQRFALLVLTALFIATINWLGTTLGLIILLTGSMLALGVRSMRTILAVSFTTAAVVYLLLIFFLNTRLPRGIVENLLAAALGAGV